jgi:hypothetical protein
MRTQKSGASSSLQDLQPAVFHPQPTAMFPRYLWMAMSAGTASVAQPERHKSLKAAVILEAECHRSGLIRA